jgi:hypothetical protein
VPEPLDENLAGHFFGQGKLSFIVSVQVRYIFPCVVLANPPVLGAKRPRVRSIIEPGFNPISA